MWLCKTFMESDHVKSLKSLSTPLLLKDATKLYQGKGCHEFKHIGYLYFGAIFPIPSISSRTTIMSQFFFINFF